MDAITTSGSTQLAPADSMRGEWSRFFTFLKKPVLPGRAARPQLSSVKAILRMLGLDLIVMSVLLGTAFAVMAAGVEIPKTAISTMKMTPELAFMAIVFAPIAEEIAFRSWLSGRSGHIAALLLVFGVGGALAASGMTNSPETVNVKAIGAAAALLVGAVAVLWALRRRDAMGWFQKLFPLFYWFSAVLFAGIHLLNFSVENMVTILPLILPQFAIGLVLGYLRVNYGLWSSMLLHMLHNTAFITLVALAGTAGA